MACAKCQPYAEHFILRGHCRVKWRGKSFDGEQALGNVGLALMQVLGYPASGYLAFSQKVRVTPFREASPPPVFEGERLATTPPGGDPPPRPASDEGEWWEFHVAVREPLDPAVLMRLKEAGRRALDRSRNFDRALVADPPTR